MKHAKNHSKALFIDENKISVADYNSDYKKTIFKIIKCRF